mgnify:CR=1 FL=1
MADMSNEHILLIDDDLRLSAMVGDYLRSHGYDVEDHWLETREATDAFKAAHDVKTTPQVFIEGKRIGGYDDLRRRLGRIREAITRMTGIIDTAEIERQKSRPLSRW